MSSRSRTLNGGRWRRMRFCSRWKRLGLVRGDDHLDPLDPLGQSVEARPRVTAAEVRAHARAQRLRLPHVEDGVLRRRGRGTRPASPGGPSAAPRCAPCGFLRRWPCLSSLAWGIRPPGRRLVPRAWPRKPSPSSSRPPTARSAAARAATRSGAALSRASSTSRWSWHARAARAGRSARSSSSETWTTCSRSRARCLLDPLYGHSEELLHVERPRVPRDGQGARPARRRLRRQGRRHLRLGRAATWTSRSAPPRISSPGSARGTPPRPRSAGRRTRSPSSSRRARSCACFANGAGARGDHPRALPHVEGRPLRLPCRSCARCPRPASRSPSPTRG